MSYNRQLIIHAPNIHQGGGRVLLLALLQQIDLSNVILLLDKRLPERFTQIKQYRFAANLLERWRAEKTLRTLAHANTIVLCLGNLPPCYRLAGQVIVYLQNRNLLSLNPWWEFKGKAKVRVLLERFWLRFYKKNAQQFYVQTPLMAKLVQQQLSWPKDKTKVFCLLPEKLTWPRELNRPVDGSKKYQFIYVASADKHKQHKNLVKAWILLAKANLFPSLVLTINDKKLMHWIQLQCQKFNLQIVNFPSLSYEQVKDLYRQTDCLIFPSTSESLGLPLIEARQHQLNILASHRDFVYQIVQPEQTFNPLVPASIAQAVQQYLKTQSSMLNVGNGEQLLASLQGA